MKKIKWIILGLVTSLMTGCGASSHQVISESSTINSEQRLVVTSVALAEMADALAIDLVGVPTSTAYTLPARYETITKIGSPMAPDLETLKLLKPTEIISPLSLQNDLKPQYDSLGLAASFIDLKSVDGLYKGIGLLGQKYDRVNEAQALIVAYEDFMADYKTKQVREEAPRVLILMGLPGSYVVATENAYVGNLVKLAGGINVFPNETEEFINVNTETLVGTKPDIILRTSHAMPEQVAAMFEKEFKENDIWSKFTAVKENHVYDLDHNLFGMSASFDYQEALEALQSILFEGA